MKDFSYFQKILKILSFFIVIGFFIFFMQNVLAQDVTTGTNFTINVAELDPIRSQSVGGQGWVGAFRSMLQSIGRVILTMVMPLLAGVAFVIAGYMYIFSYASDENVTRAKTIIKYNIIALAVAFLSAAIISVVASFL